MNLKLSAIVLVSALGLASCLSKKEEAAPKVVAGPTQAQLTSYAVGTMLGDQMVKGGVDSASIDLDYVNKAMKDVVYNDTMTMTVEERDELLKEFFAEIQEKQKAKEEAKRLLVKSEGQAFLDSNKLKEGVKTSVSGLQYKIIKKGIGAYPKSTDKVEVHYEGKLLNGKVFDSSFQRGKTIEFPLNGVIKGWTEGLQYINEGGEIELYIPYNLAYGERGAGQDIPPYSTLVFRVQLIAIAKNKPQPEHNPFDGGDHSGHNH